SWRKFQPLSRLSQKSAGCRLRRAYCMGHRPVSGNWKLQRTWAASWVSVMAAPRGRRANSSWVRVEPGSELTAWGAANEYVPCQMAWRFGASPITWRWAWQGTAMAVIVAAFASPTKNQGPSNVTRNMGEAEFFMGRSSYSGAPKAA